MSTLQCGPQRRRVCSLCFGLMWSQNSLCMRWDQQWTFFCPHSFLIHFWTLLNKIDVPISTCKETHLIKIVNEMFFDNGFGVNLFFRRSSTAGFDWHTSKSIVHVDFQTKLLLHAHEKGAWQRCQCQFGWIVSPVFHVGSLQVCMLFFSVDDRVSSTCLVPGRVILELNLCLALMPALVRWVKSILFLDPTVMHWCRFCIPNFRIPAAMIQLKQSRVMTPSRDDLPEPCEPPIRKDDDVKKMAVHDCRNLKTNGRYYEVLYWYWYW